MSEINSEIFPEANVHELPVKPQVIHEKHKIDSEGFAEEIEKFLAFGKHTWRTSGKIATHFNVDAVELDKFLSKFDKVTSKATADEVFYALKSKLVQKEEKPRPVITEQDRYALAQLCLATDLVKQILKRFSTDIHAKCPEAFSYFVEGKSKLEIGIVHLATATKANLEKLE